jgi:hypothetical protein
VSIPNLYYSTACFGVHIQDTEGAGSCPQFNVNQLGEFAKPLQDDVRRSETIGSFCARGNASSADTVQVRDDHTANNAIEN